MKRERIAAVVVVLALAAGACGTGDKPATTSDCRAASGRAHCASRQRAGGGADTCRRRARAARRDPPLVQGGRGRRRGQRRVRRHRAQGAGAGGAEEHGGRCVGGAGRRRRREGAPRSRARPAIAPRRSGHRGAGAGPDHGLQRGTLEPRRERASTRASRASKRRSTASCSSARSRRANWCSPGSPSSCSVRPSSGWVVRAASPTATSCAWIRARQPRSRSTRFRGACLRARSRASARRRIASPARSKSRSRCSPTGARFARGLVAKVTLPLAATAGRGGERARSCRSRRWSKPMATARRCTCSIASR